MKRGLAENTSVSSIELDDHAARLRFLNDILHLTDPQLFEHRPAG
jgi:hypothetical protein